MEKRVCIIGAGLSGLLACKYAVEKGFDPIVFEAKSRIGGVWTQTINSTKLQTPKNFYQFSDFPWPSSVKQQFPHHTQVTNYLQAYARHFNILPRIKFDSIVTCIDYLTESHEDIIDRDLWGGTGNAFSNYAKWKVTVQDAQDTSAAPQVYQVDFLILCIGKYSDLPNVPEFPVNKGPEAFDGEIIHSMDYAAMSGDSAGFIKDKRVTVIGFQKSAVDIAAEVAATNGAKHPCTLLFREAHWAIPESFAVRSIRNTTRFAEAMIHKPDEGFILWFITVLLSPLVQIEVTSRCLALALSAKILKWVYPLSKYNMVPDHSLTQQILSCMTMVLPANFYDRVREGSLMLKKSQVCSFCKNGLVVDSGSTILETDIVIFATGYKSEEKLKNIFASTYFQDCILGSSAPFYRECIHPRIPQLGILGYADGPSVLYTTELRSKWLAHFMGGDLKLPRIREMENEVMEWEKCMRKYRKDYYRKNCVSALLQIYCNDKLCKDMGCNPRRKKWLLPDLFSPYVPMDYKNLTRSI